MKKLFALITMAAVFGAAPLAAQDTGVATATATFEIKAISTIGVSGSPGALVIGAPIGGGDAPDPVSDTQTTWRVTTNESNWKVMGSIGAAMPAGVTLSVAFAAPGAAVSTGAQALGTSNVELVTGITQLLASELAVTYTLDATLAAGVVAEDRRVVTFTIVGGA